VCNKFVRKSPFYKFDKRRFVSPASELLVAGPFTHPPPAMYLMTYVDEATGKVVYTLKARGLRAVVSTHALFSLSSARLPPPQKLGPDGKPTVSAHPARFSPDDKFSRVRFQGMPVARGGGSSVPPPRNAQEGPLTCSLTVALPGTDSVQEAVRSAAHTEASAAAMSHEQTCCRVVWVDFLLQPRRNKETCVHTRCFE